MSKVTKTICDNCNNEVDEYFYYANIICQRKENIVGREIFNGDYCKKCFEKMIKEELDL